jgi:hypothetical protein
MTAVSHDLISVLHAKQADPARAEKLQLYGQFVGDWEATIIAHAQDDTRHETSGEIHFGWILQGRALQDVWMIPRLAERANAAAFPVAGNWYGTTLRIYDPKIDAWRMDRSRDQFVSAADRPGARQRHCPGRGNRNRRAVAVELYGNPTRFISLVR